MGDSTDELLRDLDELRQQNARLRANERELAAAIESLRQSEERLRLAVEAANMGIWEWDISSDRVSWDARKHDVFGLPPGSFAGTKEAFFALVHPDDRADLQAALGEALDHAAPYQNEFRVLPPSGEVRWIANFGRVYRDDQGQPQRMLGVVFDITVQKQLDQALRDSNERFRALVETTHEWVWAIGVDGRVEYSNPTVEQILGYRQDELTGQFLEPLVHPADQQRVREVLTASIAQKRGWIGLIVRVRHKDGAYRSLECNGVPIVDGRGDIVGFRGSDRDVTDRLRTEKELRDAHRMEGVGRVAGGFAHHFNNLLTIILGRTEIALEQNPDRHVSAELQEVQLAAQRGALLTRHLLTFVGRQFVHPQVIDLNEFLAGIAVKLRRLLSEDVQLAIQQGKGLWRTHADPNQLELLLTNLVVNAQEAILNGGVVLITTSNVLPESEVAIHDAGGLPGGYVVLAVSDTGEGMDAEVAQQIFEPFFSTKQGGSGNVGLGLSTCYGIVAQLGGHMRVLTQPEEGSTFQVFLPAHHGG